MRAEMRQDVARRARSGRILMAQRRERPGRFGDRSRRQRTREDVRRRGTAEKKDGRRLGEVRIVSSGPGSTPRLAFESGLAGAGFWRSGRGGADGGCRRRGRCARETKMS